MTDFETRVLDIIESRIGFGIPSNDVLSYVREVEQFVINYCCVPEVPEALIYTVANMSIDLLGFYEIRKQDAQAGSNEGDSGLELVGGVSSVKVGDTTIKVGDVGGTIATNTRNSHKANLDEIVMNYLSQLNMFRRIW